MDKIKKKTNLDSSQNHQCQQTAWIRSVTRALEIISGRLQEVERENFYHRIFFGITVIALLVITATHLYHSFYPSPSPALSSIEDSLDASFAPLDKEDWASIEVLTDEGWDAFHEERFELAIEKTQKCIDQFNTEAEAEQKRLIAANIPSPATGKIHQFNRGDIDSVLHWGLINNVAACFLIQGLAYEKMDRMDNALQCFQKVQRFIHARIYDPIEKKLWSPKQVAQEQSKQIEEQFKSNSFQSAVVTDPSPAG